MRVGCTPTEPILHPSEDVEKSSREEVVIKAEAGVPKPRTARRRTRYEVRMGRRTNKTADAPESERH
jgi:hypothetical protein